MAVSYARAASLDFVRMENELLRSQMASPAQRAGLSDRLDGLAKSFTDDLSVVEERSSTSDERAIIAEIRALTERWNKLGQDPAPDLAERDTIAERMVNRLDMLVELTSDSSFIDRHHTTNEMAEFTYTSSAANDPRAPPVGRDYAACWRDASFGRCGRPPQSPTASPAASSTPLSPPAVTTRPASCCAR